MRHGPMLAAAALLLLKGTAAGGDPASSASAAPELNRLQAEVERFTAAADDYRTTLNRVVRAKYEARREQVISGFRGRIAELERAERSRRVAAITLFEDFLRRYPSSPRWTPDAIFRLAELYFEQSNDDYLLAQEAYEGELAKLERKEIAVAPPPPRQNYGPTVGLHKRLIREWPSYRFIDGAHYLLGFCLAEMGDVAGGNQALLALVCRNKFIAPVAADAGVGSKPAPVAAASGPAQAPGAKGANGDYRDCVPLVAASRFNAEAWVRIGEYHFDENELAAAITAYRKVIDLGPQGNAYYDEALYKLAWTYYRADKFAEAIRNFDELVLFADRELERTGKAGSEMRPEAIQYLGISFAEEDWNGDQQPDAEGGLQRIDAVYKGREAQKHVYEVYRRLAEIYFDTTKYDDAIKVYKVVLERWPNHADNPEVQERTITALERLRQFDQAIREREEFTRRFGKGSEWENVNRNNPDALKRAREYDEQALIFAAVSHHKEGQRLRNLGLANKDIATLSKAGQEYAVAATAYAKYLDRFPHSKNSYEVRFSYASCLFYAQRFPEAAAQYAEVRDSNLDNRYQEDAAFSVTKSWEQQIQQLADKQALVQPPLPTAQSVGLKPIALPEPFKHWQQALDAYVALLPKSAKAPRLAYKAAEIAYRFGQFPDARQRFGQLYEQYCGDAMALNAGQAVLVTYQLDKNLDEMQSWATKLSSGRCGGDARSGEVATGAQKLLVGIKFKRAETLFKQAEDLHSAGRTREAAPLFDQAAVAYLALVESNPESSDADKALFNAAVAYEKSMRFESATRIYEQLWQKYPTSALAGDALWRSAENYKRFFEFKKAVDSYLIMADAPGFASSPHRSDALYNAAVILENDQDYGRAAQLFLRYAAQVGKPQEAAEAYFRAGNIYGKMGNFDQMAKVLRDFPRLYGAVPGQQTRAVEAVYRIAKQADTRGIAATASKYYKLTVQEYKLRGLAPASDGAEYAAAATFQLLEGRLADFLKAQIRSETIPTLLRRKTELERRAAALRDEYDGVLAFKRARWTLAGMERRGVIFEHVAREVATGFRELPVPQKVKRLGQDAVDIYMQQLDQALEREVRPVEDETKKLFSLCVERAQELGVSNSYTEEARRRLNALDPSSYPLLKAPRVEVVID
ncbi:MAG: tetratricopeptide repeat protein [Proteobacteria bacterium]|nr:tetratricopeptide repeat protein [Pseudomonadota bacterium]